MKGVLAAKVGPILDGNRAPLCYARDRDAAPTVLRDGHPGPAVVEGVMGSKQPWPLTSYNHPNCSFSTALKRTNEFWESIAS